MRDIPEAEILDLLNSQEFLIPAVPFIRENSKEILKKCLLKTPSDRPNISTVLAHRALWPLTDFEEKAIRKLNKKHSPNILLSSKLEKMKVLKISEEVILENARWF